MDLNSVWKTTFTEAHRSGLSNQDAASKADAAVEFAKDCRSRPEEIGDTSLIIRIRKLETRVSELEAREVAKLEVTKGEDSYTLDKSRTISWQSDRDEDTDISSAVNLALRVVRGEYISNITRTQVHDLARKHKLTALQLLEATISD